MAPRSVYSDIVLQYRVHIGADVGEKPDIGADIVFFTDIGEKTHDIRYRWWQETGVP